MNSHETGLFAVGKEVSLLPCCFSAGWLPCGTKEALRYCRRNKTNEMRDSKISVRLLTMGDHCSNLSLRAWCIHKPHCLMVQTAVTQMIIHVANTGGNKDWPHDFPIR